MNFLGMGTLEILIVMLIAFIFLGPERMVDVARVLGKWVGQARRMMAELPRVDLDEEDVAPGLRQTLDEATGVSRRGTDKSSSDTRSTSGTGQTAEDASEGGPVAFQPQAAEDTAATAPERRPSQSEDAPT